MTRPTRTEIGPNTQSPKRLMKFYWQEFSDWPAFKRVLGTAIAIVLHYELDIPEETE